MGRRRCGLVFSVWVFLLPVSMLSVTLNIVPVASTPAIIRVPQDYLTIQGAINAANSGDTIYVYNGTYFERLIVDKSVSLIGENPSITVIDGKEFGTVLRITSNNVNITQFTIQKSGFGDESAIYLSQSSNVKITNNNIINNPSGIKLKSSSGNMIVKNTISNNLAGISVETDSHNNLISDNFMLGNSISLEYSKGNTISNNTILSSSHGIYLYDSVANISGNTLSGHTVSGIYVYGNYVYKGNLITNNLIKSNGYGIRLSKSDGNIIYHNNFIDNVQQAYCDLSSNIWDDGYPSGGNYWSDYTGMDEKSGRNQDELGRDGISDTVYVIGPGSVDRYPLMKTWDKTPPFANAGQNQTVDVGTAVTFDAGASSDNVGIVGYEWDFGDGTTGIGITTTHTYRNSGIYTVTLTVKDAAGNTATKSITITVRSSEAHPQPPTETIPMWIVGAVAATIGIAVAATFLRKKRLVVKQHDD